MADLVVGDKTLDLDEDGFIQQPELWDKDVAAALAQTEGVDNLTDEHWKLVNYLNKVYELFPSGPAKGACKVAGLPKPTGCV